MPIGAAMARSSKSSKTTSKASWREKAEQTAGVAAWVCCIGLVVVLMTVVLPGLRASAYGHPAGTLTVQFPNAPRWMTAAEMKPLEERAQRIAASSGGRDLLQHLQQSLLATGWFESIEQVQLTDADRVEVMGTYATPAALVNEGGIDHLCDARGMRMARDYRTNDGPSLPRVLHLAAPTPAVANQWNGTALKDALDVLATVEAQPWRSQIAAMSVARHATEGVIELITTGGSAIVWGRAPSSASPSEVPTAQKLEYLAFLYAKHGRIDYGYPASIDVRVDCASAR